MKKILHVILILLFSLTVITCAKKSDTPSTTTTTTTSNPLFIAVGASGTLLTSSDGITWDNRTSGTTYDLRAVAYDGSSTLVAVGYSGTILTSSDGTTWTAQTSGISTDINNVAYLGSTFAAVGDSGVLLTSSDGITWTNKTSSCGMTENQWGIVLSETIRVSVGESSSIYSSTDSGSNCTKRNTGSIEFNEIFYGNSTFVVVGASGNILTSSDGINWTSRWFDTTYDFYGGAYTASNDSGNIEFVVVGESGKLLSSSNGTSYNTVTSLTSLSTGTLWGIARGGTTWVIVGASGYISTITDGESDVTTRISGTTQHLRRVFYKE